MQPYSENYNLGKKSWRALLYDWDTISTYGNTGRLYCLTDFQASWLQANVPYLAWSSRWIDCPCTDEDLSTMASELEHALMSCVDIQPWELDFNYNQAVKNALAVQDANYTAGGIPELNPDTPEDFFNGDDSNDRNNALCMASRVYVYSYASNWIKSAQASLFLSFVVQVAQFILSIGGVIPITVLTGASSFTQEGIDAMSDEEVLNNVACCMRDGLEGTAVSQANFELALNSCSFAIGSDEEIVRAIILSDLDKFSNYLTFLDALGDMFVLAENGVVDCPCAGNWEHTFDFTVSDGGWTPNVFLPTVGATWLAGQGWSTVDSSYSGVDHRRSASIKIDFVDTVITELEITFNIVKGTVNIPAGSAIVANVLFDGVSEYSATTSFGALVSGNDQTKVASGSAVANSLVAIAGSCAITPATWNGSALITSITVKGQGVNPF